MDYTDPANAPKAPLTPEQAETLKTEYQAEVIKLFQDFLYDGFGKPNGFTITVSGHRKPDPASNN